MFYIADGDATLRLAWNSGDRRLRGLILISPGDVEHEFVPVERV